MYVCIYIYIYMYIYIERERESIFCVRLEFTTEPQGAGVLV